MKSDYIKKLKMPDSPGVYFFQKGKSILYIGKATSLRDRVKSYFGKDLISTRGSLLVDMVFQSDKLEYQQTDSVLEALILEANLIKKHQPKYNTKEKDNKSFNYVCITKEKIPKVLIVRGRGLKLGGYKKVFGPFPNGLQLREAMKIIRRIFPYMDAQSSKKDNVEFYRQLGLVPVIISQKNTFQKVLGSPVQSIKVAGRPDHFEKYFSASLKLYKENLKNLILFFEGKKKKVIVDLKKEMIASAKKKEFEKAGEVKKRIFALEHINDVALIKEDNIEITSRDAFGKVLGSPVQSAKAEGRPDHFQRHLEIPFRIEAYDIAHMSGKNMVGVMTVVEGGEVNKGEYKKFIIRTQSGANDTGALEEVLSRRFRHTEWGLPHLIVVDGSTAQINVAKRVLNRYQFDIPIISVVKDDKHKAKALIGDDTLIKIYKKNILLANSEAHRFAVTFYRQKSCKNMLK